jgi:hypothetical protein
MDFIEKRREPRIPIDSVLLPFLGSREEDQATFEYLPLDISLHGVGIAIPQWVVNREKLHEGDLINLNVPFSLQGQTFHQGKIMWTRWDETLQAQVSGLHLQKQMPLYYPIYFSWDKSEVFQTSKEIKLADLLVKVLKDSMLLKKGISIYFKHLIPYFSRITGYPVKDYATLKEIFLNDINNKIVEHKNKINELYEKFKVEDNHDLKSIAREINLENFRDIIESEIYIEILKVTFESNAALQYLYAIKELEKKLYYNFNTIVMIYLQSLS